MIRSVFLVAALVGTAAPALAVEPVSTNPVVSAVSGALGGSELGNMPGQFDTRPMAIGGTVPEPGTWAMLIAGFGLVGAMVRRRRLRIA